MAGDPTTFLSTITGASVTLVAIVGGLLVARFVGLDSEQRGAAKALTEAEGTLATAQRRASEAWTRLVRREARETLTDDYVIEAIKRGVSDPREVRRLSDTWLDDETLAPLIAEVRDEFSRARQELPPRVSSLSGRHIPSWHEFRRDTPDLPDTPWPEAWEAVFDEEIERLKAKAEEARRSQPPALFPSFDLGLTMPTFDPPAEPRTTSARRNDELVATHERAQQHLEDVQGEVDRLRQARAAIVRPDGRLWIAILILTYFAIVGIALPLWVMTTGPKAFTCLVQVVLWLFLVGLAALVVFMLLYLLQLFRAQH